VEEVDRNAAFGHSYDVEIGGVSGRKLGCEFCGDGSPRVAEKAYGSGVLWQAKPLLGCSDSVDGLVAALLARSVGEVLSLIVSLHHRIAGGDHLNGDGDRARLVKRQELEGIARITRGREGVVGRLVGDKSGHRRP